jgi:hypothetical protein
VRSANSWTTPAHAAPRVLFLQHSITTPHSVLAAGDDMTQAIALELAKNARVRAP